MTNTTKTKERIQWVDAMRGFSMILVVLGHVQGALGLASYDSTLSVILLTFRMPLFFFVSGYFSFRSLDWWNNGRIADIMTRKVKAQIISPIIFLSIYEILFFDHPSWWENGFGGYWFTIALFQMYVIYLALSIISQRMKRNLIFITMIIMSIMMIGILAVHTGDGYIWNLLTWQNVTKYFQYFTLGLICARYNDIFFKLLSKNFIATIAPIGWIVCLILSYRFDLKSISPLIYSLVHDILSRYFALITVIIMFYRNSEFFSSGTRISVIMRLIGKRTLDIYLIHFFLLPDLKFCLPFFEHKNPLILLLIFDLAITSAIVSVSLLISQILRNSKTLENWLFGVRIRKITPTL